MVYNTSTSNPVYINGSVDGLSTPLYAVYGFITLFPNQLSATDVSNRYLSYLTTQAATVYDSVTTLGTFAEYYSTSAAALNGGLAVIAHDRTY